MILIAFSTIVTLQNSATAQGEPNIYVTNPLTGTADFIFNTKAAPVGFKFNATLNISNGTDVLGWQVRMNYNATILNATKAWIAPATDPDYIFFGQSTIHPSPALTSGSIMVLDVVVGTGVSFSTPKKLGIIEFEILQTPPPGDGNKVSSALDISNTDTMIVDSIVNEIPSVKTNGYYEYDWISAEIYVSPADSSFNTWTSPLMTKFNVTVWVADVTDLYAFQVYLKSDDTVLNITRAWTPRWDPQWVFTGTSSVEPGATFFDLDQDRRNDALWIGSGIVGPFSGVTCSNGLLAIIEFQIIAQAPPGEKITSTLDISALEPFETYLLNSNVDVIPCAKTNGIYEYTSAKPRFMLIQPSFKRDEAEPTPQT